MRTRHIAALAPALLMLVSATAEAHVGIGSGPLTAGATNVVTFSVGHGCAGNDTYSITIDIPAGVTSVRAMRSDFGKPAVTRDADENVTSVTWQKPDTEALDQDYGYYQLSLRLRAPDTPFEPLHFVAHQTCRASDGTLTTVDWAGIDDPDPDVEPAAKAVVLPARHAGWNKFTVGADVADLGETFAGAQIVWRGTEAFSVNPTTSELIANTEGVTELTSLTAGDEIWVKY